MSTAVFPAVFCATRLLTLYRSHVAEAVAWQRRGIERLLCTLGRTPPSQDGMFEGLADELFARWPVEARERHASRPGDGIRWAKLHEPRQDELPLAA